MMHRPLQLLLRKQKRRFNRSLARVQKCARAFVFSSANRWEVVITVISSRENKLVKEYISLRDKRNKRRETGLFVIEGARLSFDAAQSGTELTAVFITPEAQEKYADYCSAIERTGAPVYQITSKVASHLADTRTSQGIFCIAKMRDTSLDITNLNPNGLYLALENLQDPGNLGTILRTAEAMGIDGILLSSGCTDIYSPKVVRASMGAVFRIDFVSGLDLTTALSTLKAKGHTVLAAVAKGGEDLLSVDFSKGAVAVIGNEGNGLTDDCIKACSKSVTVRMRGRAESLNAAAAATVIIWEMTKKLM